jgi:hypothetical protein
VDVIHPEDKRMEAGQGREVAPPSILDLVQPLRGGKRRNLVSDDQADAVRESAKHAMPLERIGKQGRQALGEGFGR